MLNNKKIKVFNEKSDIGGYLLPADFPYFSVQFLSELLQLSYIERVKKIYLLIVGRELEIDCFDALKSVEEPCSVLAFDDCLACLDLTDGTSASYNDYLLNSSDLLSKIACLIGCLASCYLDLVDSQIIELGDGVNFTCPSFDGVFLLSLMIAKKIGIPINSIICSVEKFADISIKSLFLTNFINEETSEVIYEFFNDFGFLFDEFSAPQIIALDEYYSSYEDEKFTVAIKVLSPYYQSRSIYKTLTGKTEISIEKAISKLYDESAEAIPNCIKNGKNYFYNVPISLDFHDAISIVKSMNKI